MKIFQNINARSISKNSCKISAKEYDFNFSKVFPFSRTIDFLKDVHAKTLRKKCPYSELFWSVFSPKAGKY